MMIKIPEFSYDPHELSISTVRHSRRQWLKHYGGQSLEGLSKFERKLGQGKQALSDLK